MNSIKCNFEKIKTTYDIKNTDYLTAYLNDIFLDLTSNNNENMDKLTFINYINLPFIIADKIFTIFDKENLGYINWNNFIEGINSLYLGTMMETEYFIFQIFDFDRDGRIIPEDVRLILTFLSSEHLGKHKTTEEINQLVHEFFQTRYFLLFNDFTEIIENRVSDIYFIMIYFLYENKPFKESCVKLYSMDKGRIVNKINRHALSCKTMTTRVETLDSSASPYRKTLVQPTSKVSEYGIKVDIQKILKRDTTLDNEIEEDLKQLADFQISKIIMPILRVRTISYLDEHATDLSGDTKRLNLPPLTNQSTMSSYSKLDKKKHQQRKSCYAFEPSRGEFDHVKTMDVNKLMLIHYKEIKNDIIHEGELYKINKNGERKKFHIILLSKDIFYFKTNKIDKLKGIHNLSNSFILDYIEEFKYQGKDMYYLTLLYGEKPREYYTKSKEEAEFWLKKFKEAMRYRNIYDYYSFHDHLGNGSYGNVVLGKDEKTKELVAIKIIDKANKSQKLLEYIKTEVEIMKFCKHDNIIRFIDYFESVDQIFIVQEYLKGGDLYNYHLDFMNIQSEDKLKNIIKQVGLGVKYLHEYGIIHRDIKPQNIMLVDESKISKIKIVDFGLSKVVGSNEKANEFLGTINFSAPEVVRKIGYNNKIDIWSLGILIYYLMFGSLPFNDPDKQKFNVVSNICYKELTLPPNAKISPDLLDLLKLCVEKSYEKRIDINEFLSHRWFK
jgi:Ca2+-binding EF-hand superfamily protein